MTTSAPALGPNRFSRSFLGRCRHLMGQFFIFRKALDQVKDDVHVLFGSLSDTEWR